MVEVVAHRGASCDAPENTLSAVNLAWAQGADAVEVDVRLTLDTRIVAVHDETMLRCGGADCRVVETAFAELTRLDVGLWRGDGFAGERAPSLEDVLDAVSAGKRLFVEVKCGPEIVPVLTRIVRASRTPPEAVVVIGFGIETMWAVKSALPECQVHWVVELRDDGGWFPTAEACVATARAAGLDGIDVGRAPRLDAGFVRTVRDAGLELHVWTVDDAVLARHLCELGVDGITTNRPGWLRNRLEPADRPLAGDVPVVRET